MRSGTISLPAPWRDATGWLAGAANRASNEVLRIYAAFATYSISWSAYITAFLLLLAVTLSQSPVREMNDVVMPLGLIATWRYGWQLTHFLRAEHYRNTVFPRLRRQARRVAEDPSTPPEHIGVVVTSYQMSASENFDVYSSLFQELAAYGVPATVVASVTDDGDARLIHQIFDDAQLPGHIDLITQLQLGTGKRDAMAAALRALQRSNETGEGIVILMDGDTVVTPGLMEKTCPFFTLMPDLAALTVNNTAEVRGGSLAQAWYAMRFGLRNLYMSSLSLSRRVLCLTGRFSVFRANVALDTAFVDRLQLDILNHWRLGKLPMLTGDDKSTWYHCLKDGWAMIYLPDTYVSCMEELPKGGFLNASARLMQRWFGNMLRNSDRAILLGPRRMGLFTWWCLVDQRLSMWTSLTGPVFLTFFLLQGQWIALPAYLSIVLATRFIQTVNVVHQGGQASPFVPLLLLHQQFVGSFIKIQVLFHLDRQKWTRQNIDTGAAAVQQLRTSMFGDWLKGLVIMIFICSMITLAAITART
ncbi:glycosyltransferase [uncultured Hyphomonas sp.]|uniref:glycosyltransferase n=1 Tax=uncultured Hyphomonas sp. TaxID=225298 RepID=UPI002AAB952B|nr:glycosyltransferase [uncultured Hyphomonas sp.]